MLAGHFDIKRSCIVSPYALLHFDFPAMYTLPLVRTYPTKNLNCVALSLLRKKSRRSVPAGTNDDISVTAEVVGVYSGSDVDNVTFVTGGNSAVCGADLTVGEEYVLGLYVAEPLDSTDEKDLLTVGACGLARLWSDLSADEKDELIFGC